uniref:Uncharacterized protein n=1 Tax=Utricularia reniformis TaxID=192314 RepID=A0A1Y0B0I3_9LAMI|nr:hypothetical protein AEK19_MT0720 [Utricularia reniformis]ART30966.1 hypothetical protein AEK19_MT0720 [Utricularia reniformis]
MVAGDWLAIHLKKQRVCRFHRGDVLSFIQLLITQILA